MAGGLPHDQRIPKAREWVSSYTGDNLIKGYQKRMSVDPLTFCED
ncbi:hypothetical protein AGMMS49992_26500 [Clostridia bacterium]|nr:hypothetical protein AGMMS49992_26500 [Clostridia bacterium]